MYLEEIYSASISLIHCEPNIKLLCFFKRSGCSFVMTTLEIVLFRYLYITGEGKAYFSEIYILKVKST